MHQFEYKSSSVASHTCSTNTMFDLYFESQPDWAWLTYAQMELWHEEDEKWLKACAQARVEYTSSEARGARLTQTVRRIALVRDATERLTWAQ